MCEKSCEWSCTPEVAANCPLLLKIKAGLTPDQVSEWVRAKIPNLLKKK